MRTISSVSRRLTLLALFLLALLTGGQSFAQAPVFTSPDQANFEVGVAYTFTITTSGTAPIAMALEGFLPDGVIFTNRGNGTGTISGIPKPGSQGGDTVVVTATNNDGSTTQNLLVLVSKAAEIISNDYADFVVGSASSFSIFSDAEPAGTVAVSGTLPRGLSLTDHGFGRVTLNGTPAAGSAGVYTLTVVATNSLGTDTQTLTVTVLTETPTLADRNFSGMYYNPASSGYAVNVTHQGNVVVAAWYTFAEGGRPVWFTAATTRQPDGSFAGGYSVFTGRPFDQINNAQAYLTDRAEGTVVLRFAPDGKLDFRFQAIAYPEPQQRTLSRLTFDANPPLCHFTATSRAAATNYSDLWWQPIESGWGLSIEHQGNLIFAAWYTYAADGQPVWMTSLLSRQSDGSFNGAINRADAGVWYVFGVAGPVTAFPLPQVGNATLRFTDGEHGSFSYVIGAVAQTKMIERIVFASPAQVCATP
jgi:Putative Ig domain